MPKWKPTMSTLRCEEVCLASCDGNYFEHHSSGYLHNRLTTSYILSHWGKHSLVFSDQVCMSVVSDDVCVWRLHQTRLVFLVYSFFRYLICWIAEREQHCLLSCLPQKKVNGDHIHGACGFNNLLWVQYYRNYSLQLGGKLWVPWLAYKHSSIVH